ncbi:kinase-like domain-containing protein [Chytriomyces sp. MP71]|nr:kinase-like domain-containing protein [Chytriomyces sp. MP71]
MRISRSTSMPSSNQSSKQGAQHSDAADALKLFLNRKVDLDARFLRNYALVSQLGVGGFGFVCGAVRRSDFQPVAVKFILKNRVVSAVHGLPMELYLLKKLQHPSIIKYIEHFEDAKFYYLVTELHGMTWEMEDANERKRRSIAELPPTPTSDENSVPPLFSPATGTEQIQTEGVSSSRAAMSPIMGVKRKSSVTAELAQCSNVPTVSVNSSKNSRESSEMRSHKILWTLAEQSLSKPISDRRTQSKSPLPKKNPGCLVEKMKHLERSSTLPTFISLVMVPSVDLFECIERNIRLENDTAKHVFRQIASAVAFLHANNIVHRDLKDENIVIDASFTAKLIDFGSAMILDENSGPIRRFHGTLHFAPPEVLLGAEYMPKAADVWACGVLLYTILCGETPFATFLQVVRKHYRPPRCNCDEEAVKLMDWMMAKDPKARPTAQQVLDHTWLAG